MIDHIKKNLKNFYENDYLPMHPQDMEDLKVKFELIKPFVTKLDIRNKIAVDIGTGRGEILKMVCNFTKARPAGMDYSFSALKTLKNKIAMRFQADAENLPVKKGNIGLIYFVDLLEHLPNPEKFLYDLKKLSVNIIMSIPIESGLISDFVYYSRRLRRKTTNYESYGHLHRYTSKKILRLLRRNGFKEFDHAIVLYDNFKSLSSPIGGIYSSVSRLMSRISKPIHRILFGGYTFILLYRPEIN
jgi:ubiquinone/menaquinone biosynthesis C-methylase UbiE